MTRRTIAVLSALVASAQVMAATYTVTTDADSGVGSLRYCIEQANSTGWGDVITFQQAMVIEPATPLPALTGIGDTITGDLNDDGHPEVILNGENVTEGSGLEIGPADSGASAGAASLPLVDFPSPVLPVGTKIIGLAIMQFPENGIWIYGRNGNSVRSCYIGVTLFGDGARPNNWLGVLVQSDNNTIGGTAAKHRNLICCKQTPSGISSVGVHIRSGDNNRVLGNRFGLDWSGLYGIGHGDWHLDVTYGHNNRIGGPEPGARNLFGGDYDGLRLYGTGAATVQGNWFGVGSNGRKGIPMRTHVLVMNGSTQCLIGGPDAESRNVFGAGEEGVHIADPGTADNTVRGNLFGSKADGTGRLTLKAGVRIDSGAGAQTIGNGNRFTLAGSTKPAVLLDGWGADTRVRGNSFGVLGDGTTVGTPAGVSIRDVRTFVTGNVFADTPFGVRTTSVASNARVFRNVFRQCTKAVWVQAGLCMMGNLGNSATDDDGGNRFRSSNTWHIYNSTESGLRAEGNDFGTTVRSAIDAKVYDELDDPNKGRVDFVPLAGGVTPTGEADGRALAIVGVAAVPTERGAQVTFALSARARVTAEVVNLAGRPVRRLSFDGPCQAGTNVLLWNLQTNDGLVAPHGTYLIRVTAQASDGTQTAAITQVRVGR